MQTTNKKVSSSLVFMALEQMEDTGGSVTSQMITTKIRDLFGVDVENEYIEDFMQGLSSQLTSYINVLIMQSVSGAIVGFLSSVKLKDYLVNNRKKVFNWLKKIGTNVPTSGKIKDVVSTAIVKGNNNNDVAIRELNSTLNNILVNDAFLKTVSCSTGLADNLAVGSISAARNIEGDSDFSGSGNLLKAVLEFKATAKQGF